MYVRPKRAEAGSNPDAVKRRLAFARSCKRRYSRLAPGVPFSRLFVFSDEHVSTANDHSNRFMYARRRSEALPRERKATHNTSNVQIWAAIGYNFKSKLVFTDATPDEDGRVKRLDGGNMSSGASDALVLCLTCRPMVLFSYRMVPCVVVPDT